MNFQGNLGFCICCYCFYNDIFSQLGRESWFGWDNHSFHWVWRSNRIKRSTVKHFEFCIVYYWSSTDLSTRTIKYKNFRIESWYNFWLYLIRKSLTPAQKCKTLLCNHQWSTMRQKKKCTGSLGILPRGFVQLAEVLVGGSVSLGKYQDLNLSEFLVAILIYFYLIKALNENYSLSSIHFQYKIIFI